MIGCSTQTITGEIVEEETIKIGGILMLTGTGASWGEYALKGMQMAIDEINANDGINGGNSRRCSAELLCAS